MDRAALLRIGYLIAGIMLMVSLVSFSFACRILMADKYVRTGEAFINQSKYGAAIEPLEEATRLNPRDPNSHYFLGVALYEQGRLDESISELQKAIELFPDPPGFAEAYFYLGNALNDKGMRKEARTAWKKVLTLSDRPWAKEAQKQLEKSPEPNSSGFR